MPNTAQQLREALDTFYKDNEEYGDLETPHSVYKLIDLLPTLLDEYEKLEREAEAGRVLAEAVENEVKLFEENYKLHRIRVMSPTGAFRNGYAHALSAYHTACGKGEGV